MEGINDYDTTDVRDIAMSTARPLVHLFGSTHIHTDIIQVIAQDQGMKNKLNIRYKSHEVDDLIDIKEFDEASKYDGLIRSSWFKKVYDTLPSVMVLIYDWSQDNNNIGWNYREEEIRSSVSRLRDISREAKLMLLIFISESELTSSANSRVENKISSLRRNTDLEPKGIFFVTNGLPGFNNLAKKFDKTLQDYSLSFYKEMKNLTKNKQK